MLLVRSLLAQLADELSAFLLEDGEFGLEVVTVVGEGKRGGLGLECGEGESKGEKQSRKGTRPTQHDYEHSIKI